MKTIDFTKSAWGHNLHSGTWRELNPRMNWFQKWRVRKRKLRLFSVMVHSSTYPSIGDLIRYRCREGVATAEICGVKPCYDPPDMFTLRLYRDHALDHKYNTVTA